MVEGLEHDDGFRMVEDEFLAVAQHFTAHLHAAEYQRLKDVAASQNAETIRQISRPVVGSKSELLEKKHERTERLRKQEEARQRLLLNKATKREYSGESSGADDASDLFPRNASLYGLMASPREKAPRLDSMPGISFGLRTATGSRTVGTSRNDAPLALSFETRPPGGSAAPILDVDDDSDDLEAPGRHIGSGTRPSLLGETVRPSKTDPEKHAVSLPPPITPSDTTSTVVARQGHPVKTETFSASSKAAPLCQAHSPKARSLEALSSDTAAAYKPLMATIEPADQNDSDSDDDPFSGIKKRLAQRLGGNRKKQPPPSATKPADSSRNYMPDFL